MTMSISEERLREILALIRSWLGKTKASKRELQSLVGKLQFVAKCVPAGRVFISRLLAQLRELHDGEGEFRIGEEFQKDLVWWGDCVERFNGKSIILETLWKSPDAIIATDACLQGGGGVNWSKRRYFHSQFPAELAAAHINALELVVLVVALKLWGDDCHGLRVQVNCDNMATVEVVNSGRSRDELMLSWLRELAYWCAWHECQVRAVHIAGKSNRLPDLLSRWETGPHVRQEFRSRIGGAWREVKVDDHVFSLSGKW